MANKKNNIEKNKMYELYFLLYEDDGPLGYCPQSMSFTNPWKKLYITDDYEKCRKFVESIKKIKNRENPRISFYSVINWINTGTEFSPGKDLIDDTSDQFLVKKINPQFQVNPSLENKK